jgi:hypothetical protein
MNSLPLSSNPDIKGEVGTFRKEGNDNGLHDFTGTTNGDGDDAARARNRSRSFRSMAARKHGTATSAHELGRGHRQKRQPRAPHCNGWQIGLAENAEFRL